MDTSNLFLGFFFSMLGASYLVYGRKQQHPMAFLAGLGLCIYPYFVNNIWLTLALGAVLASLPFVVEL